MLVIPTRDDPKTSQVFVMGATESPATNNQYRLSMAILNDISLVIDAQNITRQTLVLHKDWISDENRPSCTICSRKFHFISRRRHLPNVWRCHLQNLLRQSTKFCLRCVVGLRAIDKRLEKFSPQVSKMLSINVDAFDMSATETFEEFFELDSPDPNPRASSFFTFYKNTHGQCDTSKRPDVAFPWNTTADRMKTGVTVTPGGVGSLISLGSNKILRSSSIPIALPHSSSHTAGRGLPRLSRRTPLQILTPSPITIMKNLFLATTRGSDRTDLSSL
ncbi:hypothetical protein PC116_g25555 [Phytophthora cactorum]|nr:hypothetical protein PC122_g21506 [Phytophthora cactorum]KAG4041109.1 hypothetical protein PC123_g23368 [Phytophthora cactorum]KAG4226029.1 hypothetical protein PC116_g25555 [Phytophthora cactorum]